MPDRLALIIANSDFADPKLCRLNTPLQDAEALAEVLGDPAIGDFAVTLLVDKDEREVRRKIARLYARRKKSDLLLLYYSGHGIRDAHGDLYLATRDTEMDLVGATALDAAYVRTQIDKSGSQRKVVVLDCCHSGAFAKAGLGDSVGTEDAFAGSGFGRVILTASDALELAWEGGEWLGEGQSSVFTHFLVEGLRTGAADLDGDGKIALDELYDYVYERILTSGHAKQTPHKWAQKVQGQIVIARAPRPEVALPDWIVAALASAAFSARLAAVGELAQLTRGENAARAAAARAELKRVSEQDDDPAIRGAAAGALGVGRLRATDSSAPPFVPTVARPEPNLDVLTITTPIQMELMRIPAGPFLMGSDPARDEQASDDEQPQHTLELPEFYIGKYPITNAQYATFVQATGHRQPNHWKAGRIPAGKEAHPVVHVGWKDALAFCDWLKRETGREFTLPSEAEWEKAARGADGRIYPWGDDPPTPELCNFGENVGDTTPVGKYSPHGDSPYKCIDMIGNVWEWTRSIYTDYRYDPNDGREDLSVRGDHVLRGGSWGSSRPIARCASRCWLIPNFIDWNASYGFRVVVSPVSPLSAL
jgi:formylglycine-generating enzyme required for sulfatase activity